MARSIQKSDNTFFGFNMISADMLGNTARFAFGHTGFANHVEQ